MSFVWSLKLTRVKGIDGEISPDNGDEAVFAGAGVSNQEHTEVP